MSHYRCAPPGKYIARLACGSFYEAVDYGQLFNFLLFH